MSVRKRVFELTHPNAAGIDVGAARNPPTRRRRIRMCWKQWRWVRTKVRHLLALETSKRQAILSAASSKSYWHLSKDL